MEPAISTPRAGKPTETPLHEFIRRTREVNAARGIPTAELSNEGWAALARKLSREESSIRLNIRMAESDISWLPSAREALADIRYTTGQEDEHPLIHGAPETLRAADMSGRHLGWTFSSITYPGSNKTAAPSVNRTYTADSIHHLTGGGILLNGSGPYLRPDTELTVVAEALTAAA